MVLFVVVVDVSVFVIVVIFDSFVVVVVVGIVAGAFVVYTFAMFVEPYVVNVGTFVVDAFFYIFFYH